MSETNTMKSLSKKEIALLISPILAGACFIATVLLNHTLFKSQIISVRQAIGHEIFVFLIGFFTTVILLALSIRGLLKKQWRMALLYTASTALFWVCISIGKSHGAALFYAT